MNWSLNVKEIEQCLHLLSASVGKRDVISVDVAFGMLIDWTMTIREQKKIVFLIGNGASASMASHVAADLAKNGHIHTEVFTDLSLITAVANDMSFEDVFAEPLKRRLKQDDMLLAISSSGKSPNILRAAETAKKHGGKVITLSAMDADNPLRKMGDLNFHVPAKTYGMAESCHAAILHHWIDMVVSSNKISDKD